MVSGASGTRGRVAFHLFTAVMLEMGIESFIPLKEEAPVDLLVFKDGAYQRVQIKRVYDKDGHRTINLKRRNGDRYKRTEIDAVAAVDVSTGTVWLIPFDRLWEEGEDRPLGRLRLTQNWKAHVIAGPA